MALWGRSPLLVIPLWMSFGSAAAHLGEPQICYILDGILFLYGIILTALYCRIKIYNAREAAAETAKVKQNTEEAIYTENGKTGSCEALRAEAFREGLTHHGQDTYETIGKKK